MSVRRIATGFAILAVLTCGAAPALAKKKQSIPAPAAQQGYKVPDSSPVPDSSTLNGSGGLQAVSSKDLDPTTAFLLWQLSHKPELMNPEYLSYYLGPPDTLTNQIGIRSHAYYWYDRMRQPYCELYQEVDKPGEIVESQMLFHLPQSEGFNFEELEKPLGPPVRAFFDHDGHATQMFAFVPYTTLSLASPSNTFSIRKATVTYKGPVLGKPSAEDLQIGHDYYVAKSRIAANSSKTNWQNALLYARQRVTMHPQEAEAHIALAQALKKTGNVHDAINEYKLAMSLNKYNRDVQDECIQGLKDLRVLPKNFNDLQGSTGLAGKRTLQFSHSGGKAVAATGNKTN